MTHPTSTDIRDALRWAVASGVLLSPSDAGGLDVEGSVPMPEPVRITLVRRAGTILKLLAITGSPPVIAQLAVYWELERRLRCEDERDALEELAEERAGIREHEGGMDAGTAEICALGDVARILLGRTITADEAADRAAAFPINRLTHRRRTKAEIAKWNGNVNFCPCR